MDSWISIQSLSWDSVKIRFGLPQFVPQISACIMSNGQEILKKESGNNNTGHFLFEGLQPDTEYTYTLTANDETFSESFRTLPKPQGKHLFKMAILADWHLSLSENDSKGRLLAESADIIRLFLRMIVERGCDIVLSPGDVTNQGLPAEYALADLVLKDFPLPFYATPGNHDTPMDVEHIFQKMFGSGCWIKQYKDFQLVALDTSDGRLDKQTNNDVVSAVNTEQPVILFTHYQLLADDWIPDANRVIADADTPNSKAMLEKLFQCHGIFYIGHKNVAAQVKCNGVTQLNTPQPTHFPAGYLEADFYTDGVWHRFIPLPSEVQNEYSRIGTEHSKPHWRPGSNCRSAYRDSFTKELWNQVIRLQP